jgi:hypothetical protein
MGAGHKLRCKKCGEIIQSLHRHDMVMCGCKAVGIDGGSDYSRVIGNMEDWEYYVVKPCYYSEAQKHPRRRFRRMPPELIDRIEAEVKAVLHDSRDALRNRREDTTKLPWNANDSWYAEAFGVMRGLALLHYGYTGGPVNLDGLRHGKGATQPQQNLKWWFEQLTDEVLAEEGFGKDNKCAYCLKRFGKDGASMKADEPTQMGRVREANV